MRTIYSRRFVGALLPPWKAAPLVGVGKMPPNLPPAFRRAVAFGSIRQSGIGPGSAPPSAATQVAWVAASHLEPKLKIPVGTAILTVLPLYVAGSSAPEP